MVVRSLLVVAFALALAGCATGPVNTLTQDRRDALRIDAVEVTFAPDAKVDWFDGQGGGPVDPVAQQAYLRQKALGPIKAALDAEIRPAFRGAAPATLKVRIRRVYIPATATRIIIANIPYEIRADLELVDNRTGKSLLVASDFDGLARSYGGVAGILEAAVADDPIIRVSKAFAHVLMGWLKTGRAQGMY
jgi:hypothetical protein